MQLIKNRITTGKILVSFIALFTAVSPYLADWNITHIYNPTWPPHAKFHNAQTMAFGALLGLLSLYCMWIRKGVDDLQKLNEAALVASLYWIAQLPAMLFPGTALADPGGYQGKMPVVLGIQFNQVVMDVTIILPLVITGYLLERKRIIKQYK